MGCLRGRPLELGLGMAWDSEELSNDRKSCYLLLLSTAGWFTTVSSVSVSKGSYMPCMLHNCRFETYFNGNSQTYKICRLV